MFNKRPVLTEPFDTSSVGKRSVVYILYTELTDFQEIKNKG